MLSKLPHIRSRVHRLSGAHKLLITVFLLAINAGFTNLIIKQVTTHTNAANLPLVKDVKESLDHEGELSAHGEELPLAVDDKQVITTYTVSSGDTLSAIASKFHISTATILWANGLTTKSKISVGMKLTILPVTGIQYTVKKGDTISGIAAKFDADGEEIMAVNDFEDANDLKMGTKIIIPDAEPLPAPTPVKTAPKKSVGSKSSESVSAASGYYAMPIPGAILTQGKHGTNGIDFGAPIGTSVYAAAGGTVLVAKGNGAYNGGYGNYVVIEHGNGTQTLYAHLSKTTVSVGDRVGQNDLIGKSGNTGKSTGPHLHFEVRGATNPFAKYSKGTHF